MKRAASEVYGELKERAQEIGLNKIGEQEG
jgi:hypothetical protein